MSFEKRWAAIPPSSFTADGGTLAAGNEGLVTIPNTIGYHEKQQVIINATGFPSVTNIEVKAVISSTQMYVGPKGGIGTRSDLTNYTVANGALIYANTQDRPSIPLNDVNRAVFEEAPASAARAILVDDLGDKYNAMNPFPVSVSTSPVANPGLTVLYNQVTNVLMGVQTTILTYTTPPSGFRLFKIDVSGENVAAFTVLLNSNPIALKRTYWGKFNESFEFENFDNAIDLNPGDVILVSVLHERPSSADFNATFYGLLL